ncbi:MAG TPA: hypothetical protein VMT37_00555 [Solirubrobacterales bacterium]|nr:hypothetical protein [Solirubrobacterales bacterium]
MGLSCWLGTEGYSPSPGAEEVAHSPVIGSLYLIALVAVPLIVGRWWVVASLAGWLVALVILQVTGHWYQGSDGWSRPLNPLAFFGMTFFGLLMLALVGIRKAFDFWRGRRSAADAVTSPR